MRAISPVIPGREKDEVAFGKNQPQYQTLPALPYHEEIHLTRWRPDNTERAQLVVDHDIVLFTWADHDAQPVRFEVRRDPANIVLQTMAGRYQKGGVLTANEATYIRWTPSDYDRQRLHEGADIYLWIWVRGVFRPILPTVAAKMVDSPIAVH